VFCGLDFLQFQLLYRGPGGPLSCRA